MATLTLPGHWTTTPALFTAECNMCGRLFDPTDLIITDGEVAVCSVECAMFYDGVEPPEADDPPPYPHFHLLKDEEF